MIIETQYLPPIDTFILASKYKTIYIEAHENYQKKSFRNRAIITGANGKLDLSIPLKKGKHNQKSIREVEISYTENWPKVHAQSIRSAYQSAPYYDYYADPILEIIQSGEKYLYELNMKLLNTINKAVCLTIKETEEYLFEVENDFRSTLSPNSYAIDTQDPYPQVFNEKFDFIEHVSIVDALFCLGPELPLYLNSQ